MGIAAFSWLSGVQAATDCTVQTDINEEECHALVEFYISTDGANWINNTGWNVTNAPCSWKGVGCFNGHVTSLDQRQNQLNGSIPESLGNLSRLQNLNLKTNQLSGSIPESLSNLNNLQKLILLDNQLSGSIPESLGNLSNLQHLFLNGNQLSGFIPESLGNLKNLQRLSLGSNQLSGSIPASLGNLSHLYYLGLLDNQLNGSIPASLGNLSNLKNLDLRTNQLSGSIPESLGNLSHLQSLILFSNQLSGSIPESLGNLTHLQSLILFNNQLSGSIPESLGNLNNLSSLYLHSNHQLSGSIPESLGNLSNLHVLLLSYNQLSGSIPESLENLNNLQSLALHHNQLSGSIPESLGNLSNLQSLYLNNNELCGDIPLSLMNLSMITGLRLSDNHLTTSDTELIAWLDANSDSGFNWMDQTPCQQTNTCLVYGVHDGGLNDSQFFSIDSEDFEVKPLGSTYFGHDIEALDTHPHTAKLFAASGKDTKKRGYLYSVDKTTGQLTEIGATGFKEIDGLSFHPDGTLWGWATGDGLVTINTTTGQANLEVPYLGEVEDLTWNTAGTVLFGVENLETHSDAGVRLLAYDGNTVTTVCQELTQSLEIEALDTLPDDSLLFGLHNRTSLPLGALDVTNCQIIAEQEIATDYNDAEGIAWPNCQ